MKFDAVSENPLSKHFIKLKDGEKQIGLLRGESKVFYQHWVDKVPYTCKGRGGCELCEKGNKARFRFHINMIVEGENKKPEAKILAQGRDTYKQLAALHEEFPLDKNWIKIVRTGTTMQDTKYTVIPMNKTLTPETERLLSDVKLLPIDPNDPFWNPTKQHEIIETHFDTTGEDEDEDVPF